MRRLALATAAALALPAAGACSSAVDSGGRTVPVTATDTTCEVAQTSLAAGSTTFAIKNTGSSVTEVYVYGPGDDVKGERENIGPGTSRNLAVELSAGDYQVACKPGIKGTSIRTPVTVTG